MFWPNLKLGIVVVDRFIDMILEFSKAVWVNVCAVVDYVSQQGREGK